MAGEGVVRGPTNPRGRDGETGPTGTTTGHRGRGVRPCTQGGSRSVGGGNPDSKSQWGPRKEVHVCGEKEKVSWGGKEGLTKMELNIKK